MHADIAPLLDDFIDRALYEDVQTGDHTSLACIPPTARSKARLLVKDEGVLAGMEVAKRVFEHVDPFAVFEPKLADGDKIAYGEIAFIVECNTQALLKAERLVLNTMQRMSGIATLSRQYAEKVADLPVTILDTRKTTPLLRFLEKWAVRIGGCHNYRDGLYDWFMLKDNHNDACGGIPQAIERVAAYQLANNLNLNVTVEVRNLEELQQVLDTGKVTRIMFDNFSPEKLQEAVKIVDGRFETEASGGINLATLRDFALAGVNFISVGALTHSAQSLDLSLKIIK
jgi:nicotinate-nucleotide pyrophosphorylase (carboxylating)